MNYQEHAISLFAVNPLRSCLHDFKNTSISPFTACWHLTDGLTQR